MFEYKSFFKLLLSAYIIILSFSCTNNNSKTIRLGFPKSAKTFDEIFELKKILKIPSDQSETKILNINKIIKYKEEGFIISDIYESNLLLIDNNGFILKKIAGKGKGPGEYQSIVDFEIDKSNKLFVVDVLGKKLGFHDENLEFERILQLSFSHRSPWDILLTHDGGFIISAFNNLNTEATRRDYEFLEYGNTAYLNYYDSKFDYNMSFLNPDKELVHTNGYFFLPNETYAIATTFGDHILAMTQEGLYRIKEFDVDHELEKEYHIESDKFKEFDFNEITGISFNRYEKPSISKEKRGQLIANHTVPVSCYRTNNYLGINFCEPYENYYFEFSKEPLRKYYIDFFKIDDMNKEIIPVVNYFKNEDSRIIGANDREFYISSNLSQHDEVIDTLRIYIYVEK